MESPGKDAPRTETWGEAPARVDAPDAAGLPALPPRFRRDRLLGSGGQADVFLAHDLELDQVVAIKLFRQDLDPVARERLRREVRLGRELSHPRLVRMYELVEAGDRLGVVMEWIAGGSLTERVKQAPFPVADVVGVGREVLEALVYLHDKGVLHRDVKPSNVLVGADGGFRLADYGLARPIGEGSDLTRTSVTVGTPGFMSPEQLRGDEPGPASDLYGLGVTLFHLLTGRAPFVGPSEFEVARQHLTEPPPSPRKLRPDCPPWLARFVLRLLEKRPADRFASAEAALAALETRSPSVSPRARRRRLLVAAGAAGLAALAAGGTVAVRSAVRRPVAVHVAPAGDALRGLDARGDQVFSLRFRSPVDSALEVDFGRFGGPVTVATAQPRRTEGPDRFLPSEIAAVDRAGRVLFRSNVEDLILSWDFPYPKSVASTVRAFDLTGDGVPELVVTANQRTFYPGVVLVYWPAVARWEQVLHNDGHVWMLEGGTRGGEGRLGYYAGANTLGWLTLCGALGLVPPRTDRGGGRLPFWSRDDSGSPGLAPLYATLLPMLRTPLGAEPTSLALEADGGIVLASTRGPLVRLDRFGNPVPGPLVGANHAGERAGFLTALRQLGDLTGPRPPLEVAALVSDLRSRFAALMGEPANRMALALVGARAVAAAGDVEAGAEALRRAIAAGDGSVDLEWRLAHLEAVAGDLVGARRRTEGVVRAGASVRSDFDAPLLLVRILAEMRERDPLAKLAERIIAIGGLDGNRGRRVAVLHLRAHLLWDDLGSEDLAAEWFAHLPEAPALAALARWRKGRTGPGDVEAMETGERESPDAAFEYRLARAAALLGLGRKRDALEVVTGLVNVLGPRARVDFGDRQTLDLAEALRVKALAAGGEEDRARQEALRLRARLRPGLLPRILVEEVLRGGPAAR